MQPLASHHSDNEPPLTPERYAEILALDDQEEGPGDPFRRLGAYGTERDPEQGDIVLSPDVPRRLRLVQPRVMAPERAEAICLSCHHRRTDCICLD